MFRFSNRYAAMCAVGLFFASTSQAQDVVAIEGVIASNAKLELISDGYEFTEGPACDASGNVFFTDQPNDRILRFDVATRKVETWMQPAGRSNGLFFAPDGTLIACADGKNELWSIHVADKSHQVIVGKWQDKLFNGPNDCWVDSDGSIYFTDPFYKRPYWDRGDKELENQDVYRVSPNGKTITLAASEFQQPNGIVGDRDKRVLFVADIREGKTYRFRISETGELVDRKLHCESGSDGMTLDREGRLYVTGKAGVTVFDPDGKNLGSIPTPAGWTANVCFGGKNRDELFITAQQGFYAIKTLTRGL